MTGINAVALRILRELRAGASLCNVERARRARRGHWQAVD